MASALGILHITVGLIILSGHCAGDLICYSPRFLDHRTVRIHRTVCNNYTGIYLEFQSEQEVSVSKLLDSANEVESQTISPSSLTTDPDCGDWSVPDPGSYIIRKTKMTWYDAATACKGYDENAHLVFIECESENKFILSLIEEELRNVICPTNDSVCDFWIGLNDLQEKGVWKWYDKTAHFFDNQIFHVSGEELEDCGRIADTSTGVWADTDCFSKLYYICEI